MFHLFPCHPFPFLYHICTGICMCTSCRYQFQQSNISVSMFKLAPFCYSVSGTSCDQATPAASRTISSIFMPHRRNGDRPSVPSVMIVWYRDTCPTLLSQPYIHDPRSLPKDRHALRKTSKTRQPTAIFAPRNRLANRCLVINTGGG